MVSQVEAFLDRRRTPRRSREGGLGGEGGLPIGGGLRLLLGGWEGGQPLVPMVLLSRALALSPAREAPSNVCRGRWWASSLHSGPAVHHPLGQDLGRLGRGSAHWNWMAGESALDERAALCFPRMEQPWVTSLPAHRAP